MTLTHTIYETTQAVRDGQIHATEIVETCLKRIEDVDPRLHAFIHVERERALASADRVDSAVKQSKPLGALAGVPIAVKDNMCTTFGVTTCGSGILESFQSGYNAHVVDRLENAGAIIIGKTNLDEFAMGSSTENSAFGTTLNPWDHSRVAGGSSGGSTAAVAARIVCGALGSDTGGSIRQPASFCGVVGLKPSYGRVSRYGLVAFASSLDQIGPITLDVRDAALLLQVIAGNDPRDSTSVDTPVPDYVQSLDHPPLPLRVGVAEEYFADGLDPAVQAAVQTAIDHMEGQGARIVPVKLPHMKYAVACYYIVAPAEASSNLARFDGVHYGFRDESAKEIVELYSSSRGQGFGAEVKRRIMLGTYVLSSGYYDAYYVKALKVRTLIKRDFDDAFNNVDVIASPVAPSTAFVVGEKVSDPLAMYLSDIYTISANLAGICGISVPCGLDGDGLPIGLQLLAPSLGEEQLLAVAHQFQMQTDHHHRKPALCNGS